MSVHGEGDGNDPRVYSDIVHAPQAQDSAWVTPLLRSATYAKPMTLKPIAVLPLVKRLSALGMPQDGKNPAIKIMECRLTAPKSSKKQNQK